MIFEKYRQNISIFQTLSATMGTAMREEGLSGRRRGFAAFWGGGLFSARDGGGWGMLEGTGGGFQRVLPLGRRSSGRRQWE